jgi:hypothetical protein
MVQDHAHALTLAKEQLLAQRRRLIERFAAGWWPGASENDVDLLVRLEKAIDVVNNLIKIEPALMPKRALDPANEYEDILPKGANDLVTV